MIRTIVWGLVIVAFGVWIWLGKLGRLSQFNFGRDWPVIIIVVGLLTVAEGVSWLLRKGRKRCGD